MKRILIIHFRSATDYPPVYNFARYLATQHVEVTLLTGKRKESASSLQKFGVNLKEVDIEKKSRIANYVAYVNFYFKACLEVLRARETPVIYFESISCLPVFFYFLLFPFSQRSLSIHYHEYFDKAELGRQSFLERFGRRLEPTLFKRAGWISHTNADRLKRFADEFAWIKKSVLKIMPNYPPENWLAAAKSRERKPDDRVKLVYVGSISIEDLYLKELIAWLRTQGGNLTCDVYSKYITDDVISLIESQPNNIITYKGNVAYDNLPSILPQYDVGLILYNGISSTNFIYNAPNKLFEYMACDLDVWFSDTLVSSYEYETKGTYPKVVKVDFKALEFFDYKAALMRKGLSYKKSNYVMESVYEKFCQTQLNG